MLARQDQSCVKEIADAIMAFEKAHSKPVIKEAGIRCKVKPSPVIAGSLGHGKGGHPVRPIVRAARKALEPVVEGLPQGFHNVCCNTPRHLHLK